MGSLDRRWLSEWTSGEVASFDFSDSPVVISTSAFEQHGRDTMPLGTDYYLAKGLVAHTLAAMKPTDPGLFLPPVPFGYSPEHTHFAGTITLGYQTYLSLMLDIAASLALCGVKKVLVLNFHGGNPPLNQIAIMEMRNRHGIIAAEYNYARDVSLASKLFGEQEASYGYHAGAAEFALGLFLFPELLGHVKRGNYPSAFVDVDRSLKTLRMGSGVSSIAWHTENANPTGAIGNSLKVTADQGKALADDVAAKIISVLQDLNSSALAQSQHQAPSAAK